MTGDERQALHREERDFMHSIATPIGTVYFLLDAVQEALQANSGGHRELLEQLDLARQAMEKLKEQLRNRRDILIKRGGQ